MLWSGPQADKLVRFSSVAVLLEAENVVILR